MSSRARDEYPAQEEAVASVQPAPDFMMLAAGELSKAIRAADNRARDLGESDATVLAVRLEIADRLIALAEIQYGLPDEDDDLPGDY